MASLPESPVITQEIQEEENTMAHLYAIDTTHGQEYLLFTTVQLPAPFSGYFDAHGVMGIPGLSPPELINLATWLANNQLLATSNWQFALANTNGNLVYIGPLTSRQYRAYATLQ